MKKNLIVFDVCNTITKINNTSYFISFVLKKNPIRLFLFSCFLLLLKVILTVSKKSTSLDIFLRRLQIMFLKGYRKDYLEKKAQEYINYLKSNNLFNKKILGIIKKGQDKKNQILLISASIDLPIKNIAKFLGIDSYFSSQLNYNENICTGRLRIDLFGNKQKVIFQKLIDLKKYKKSSVYSDNLEDVKFINYFDSANIILKNKDEEKLWEITNKKIKFILTNNNYSINELNRNLIYIPSFYYFISRFRLKGTIEDFLFKQLFPYSVILATFSWLSLLKSFFLSLNILIVFYSIYEIGGLFNDLKANQGIEKHPTKRLSPNVKINILFFITIRFLFLLLSTLILYFKFYGNLKYFICLYGLLIITLLIYIIHSLLKTKGRILSFTILKILRNFIPLLILYYFLPKNLFLFIFILFFLLDAPTRIYHYFKKQNLIKKIFLFEKKSYIIISVILISLFRADKKLYFIPLYFLALYLINRIRKKIKPINQTL
jgi:phosphoserine phosphatase